MEVMPVGETGVDARDRAAPPETADGRLPDAATATAPLTIVLVHRDQPERCVTAGRALLDQGVPVELIVVDNGSSGEARAHLANGLPEARILPQGHNAGFGPGANAGLRHWLAQGTGEWVAIAPHDVEPAPGCLAALLDAVADRPRAGLASVEFGQPLKPVIDQNFGGIERPAEPGQGWEDAGYPHGTFMIARRACLDEVGLFDERYFAYCEEADLAIRARRAGWDVGIVWGARVRNTHISNSLSVVDYLKLRNTLLLIRSHFGRYRLGVLSVFKMANTLRHLLRPSRRPAEFDVRARRLATRDFLAGRFGPPPAELYER